MGEVIRILSAKGGVGKTTAAALLALKLAERGKRTCLADLCFGSGDLAYFFGFDGESAYHLLDVLEGTCRVSDALHKVNECLYLMPAPFNRSAPAECAEKLSRFIGALKEKVDYLILDTPAGMEEDRLADEADRDIVVLTGASHVAHCTERYLIARKCRVPVSVLINRLPVKLLKTEKIALPDRLLKNADVPILGVVPEDETVFLIPETGFPLGKWNSPASRAMSRIAARVLGEKVPVRLS